MSELSIFIDESGDFGSNSKYYLLTLVFHDQGRPLDGELARLDASLSRIGFPTDCALHAGPIIRREKMYAHMGMDERRRVFSLLSAFTRRSGASFKTLAYRKREFASRLELKRRMARDLALFIDENMAWFSSFDRVIAYYDNGQAAVTEVIGTVFASKFFDVDFRKVLPSEYRLFQSADLVCTLELSRLKLQAGELSASELAFFGSPRDLRRNHLKQLDRIRFTGKR